MHTAAPYPAYEDQYFLASDGLRLFVRTYGTAISNRLPVLCLPGLTRNAKDFHALAQDIAKSRMVITLDYRGRGRSDYDPSPENYTPQTYLEDIRHILAALDVHHCIVVGTSLGGILAQGLCLTVPKLVHAIILNDIGPELDLQGLRHIQSYLSDPTPKNTWEDALATAKTMFAELNLTTDADWHTVTANTYRQTDSGQWVFDWDTAITKNLTARRPLPDLWPLFHAIANRPLMCIRGGISKLLGAHTFTRMQLAKPQARYITQPHVGHAPTLAEPFAHREVMHFLASLP
jgi:pimeloyl-ACP methyl ester carboxylesterase